MKTAYKIFDVYTDKNGNAVPKTLFHGIRGSRIVQTNEWIDAEHKSVIDGSGQERYISGFHAYSTIDDVKKWLRGAKNLDNRVVVKVHIAGMRSKPRAVRSTVLADRMKVTGQAWAKRKRAKDVL